MSALHTRAGKRLHWELPAVASQVTMVPLKLPMIKVSGAASTGRFYDTASTDTVTHKADTETRDHGCNEQIGFDEGLLGQGRETRMPTSEPFSGATCWYA